MRLQPAALCAAVAAAVFLRCGGVPPAVAQGYDWSTLAGNDGGVGFRDGPTGSARFLRPGAVATGPGGAVYLADTGNHTVRIVAAGGMVTTLAGRGGIAGHRDGAGAAARFNGPAGIAVDGAGLVYVADTGNHVVRAVSATGQVITLAGQAGVAGAGDGTGVGARFSSPGAMLLALDGSVLVADTNNHAIRRVTPDGVVSTIVGQAGVAGSTDGPLATALLRTPKGLALASDGTLYIGDSGNRVVRMVTPAGEVSTLAGLAGVAGSVDGIGSAARFSSPEGVVVAGGAVYVADFNARVIRRIDLATRMVTTFAGKAGALGLVDGTGAEARFGRPAGMAAAVDGAILVADSANHALRRVADDTAAVSTLVANPPVLTGSADGVGAAARFTGPSGVALGPDGRLYAGDGGNHTLRAITAAGEVVTFAGAAGQAGSADGLGGAARFEVPVGLAFGPDGVLHVADLQPGGDGTVRRVTPAGEVSTLAGMPGTLDRVNTLRGLAGIAVDPAGNTFACDVSAIRKITPAGGVSFFAGQVRKMMTFPSGETVMYWRAGSEDGTGTSASFGHPHGLAIDGDRNLFVAERLGCTIRKVTPAAVVTTLAGLASNRDVPPGSTDGTGAAARFDGPKGIAVDAAGNLFVADTNNHTIRRVTPSGLVTTIGGIAGYAGCGEGIGDRALFNEPAGIAVDAAGRLYVADTTNHRIVVGSPRSGPQLVVEDPAGVRLTEGGAGVDFGHTAPGETGATRVLTIRNAGDEPLVILGIELSGGAAGEFGLVGGPPPAVVAAGGSAAFGVAMTPAVHDFRDAVLRLVTGESAAGALEIRLHGVGNSAPRFDGYRASVPAGVTTMIPLRKLLAAVEEADGDPLAIEVKGAEGVLGQLRVVEGALSYLPPSPAPASERFLVTFRDPFGAVATGNLLVEIQAGTPVGAGGVASNPARLTVLPGGGIEVAFAGIPGRPYQIQRTTDLPGSKGAGWQTIATVAADDSGRVRFTDASPPLPAAYYRIVVP